MAKPRSEPITLADGGPTVTAEVTGLLGLHTPLDDGDGYILTHIPSGRFVMRVRLKSKARELQKELEALDWSDPEALRPLITLKTSLSD